MSGAAASESKTVDEGHGPVRIEENNITACEFHSVVILIYHRLADNLKDSEIMILTIEASILTCPFDTGSIATMLEYREPANIPGAHPTSKGVRVHTIRVVSANSGAHYSSPLFVTQF